MKTDWTKDSHKILETATNLPRYNKWVVSLFQKHFGKNILEIGSGLGGLSQLLPHDAEITLSDLQDDYFNYLKKKFVKIVIKLDIENDFPKSLQNKFDTLFSSNVFEHIKNDEFAFDNSFSLLRKHGKLLIFVPARPEIYGELDADMGHFRRYTKNELINKAKKSGFKVIKCFYANFPGYFLWWGRGRLLKTNVTKIKTSSSLDLFLAQFVDLVITPLLYLEKFIHPPFGQSLVLIAEKN